MLESQPFPVRSRALKQGLWVACATRTVITKRAPGLDSCCCCRKGVDRVRADAAQTTASMQAKARTKRQPQKLSAAATAELAKAEAIHTNEVILATMKDRLSKVEENLRTLAAGF